MSIKDAVSRTWLRNRASCIRLQQPTLLNQMKQQNGSIVHCLIRQGWCCRVWMYRQTIFELGIFLRPHFYKSTYWRKSCGDHKSLYKVVNNMPSKVDQIQVFGSQVYVRNGKEPRSRNSDSQALLGTLVRCCRWNAYRVPLHATNTNIESQAVRIVEDLDRSQNWNCKNSVVVFGFFGKTVIFDDSAQNEDQLDNNCVHGINLPVSISTRTDQTEFKFEAGFGFERVTYYPGLRCVELQTPVVLFKRFGHKTAHATTEMSTNWNIPEVFDYGVGGVDSARWWKAKKDKVTPLDEPDT